MSFSLQPSSYKEATEFAALISKSSFCPKQFVGKPADVLIAIQMGAEVGLAPIQALQNIAVINGRPSIWGDAALALSMAHPEFESKEEYMENGAAICKIKRKGMPEHIAIFTIEDAKKARLWGKSGPWTDYPDRMLQMRARGFALRDTFPDALKGLIFREEAQDYPIEKDVTPKREEPTLLPEKPIMEADAFDDAMNQVKGVTSLEELQILGRKIAEFELTQSQREQLKEIYKSQQDNLKKIEIEKLADEFFNEEQE